MSKKQVKLTEQVRRAASKCEMSQNALARAAGMDNTALSRFITGTRGLSMENLDALADVLGLDVVVREKHGRKAKR